LNHKEDSKMTSKLMKIE